MRVDGSEGAKHTRVGGGSTRLLTRVAGGTHQSRWLFRRPLWLLENPVNTQQCVPTEQNNNKQLSFQASCCCMGRSRVAVVSHLLISAANRHRPTTGPRQVLLVLCDCRHSQPLHTHCWTKQLWSLRGFVLFHEASYDRC